MTIRIDDGGPAFPTSEYHGGGVSSIKGGLTMRDYFAAAAMQGLAMLHASITATDESVPIPPEIIAAKAAYDMADAMLAVRQTKEAPDHKGEARGRLRVGTGESA